MTASAPFTPFVPPRVGEVPVDLGAESARARTRGYAEGYAAGRAEAAQEAERLRRRDEEAFQERQDRADAENASAASALRTAVVALQARTEALAGQSTERIEELALSLATVILDAELSDPARSAAHALRRAVAEQPVRSWVRVGFSARDAAVLAADPSATALLDGVEIVVAADVDPGGAVVDLEDGAVDARVGAALARATAAHREGASEIGEEVG